METTVKNLLRKTSTVTLRFAGTLFPQNLFEPHAENIDTSSHTSISTRKLPERNSVEETSSSTHLTHTKKIHQKVEVSLF